MDNYAPKEGETEWTSNGYAAHWENGEWHFHVPCAITRFGRLGNVANIVVLVGDTNEHGIAWDRSTLDRPMSAALLVAWRTYRAAAISRVTKPEAGKMAKYARNFGNRVGGLTVAVAAETAYHRIIWEAYPHDPVTGTVAMLEGWRPTEHAHIVEQLTAAANELFTDLSSPAWRVVIEEARDLEFAYRANQRQIQPYKGLVGICAHICHSLGHAPNGVGRLHGAASHEFRF